MAKQSSIVEHRRDSAGEGDPERRVNQARDWRMTKRKKDPLLAALIAKLPEQGSDWPVEQQLAWLQLTSMAFGAVYGGDAATKFAGKAAEYAKATAPAPKPVRKPGFYIDPDGYARNTAGKPIKSSDIDPGTVLFDERGQDGDLRSIIWADGSTGLNGKDLTISAA